jgi:hydroxymethylglutaryl-CoA lyase
MQGMGTETGVDLNQVVEIGDSISKAIGRPNVSRAGKALLAKQQNAEEI